MEELQNQFCQFTSGTWDDEADACAELDRRIEASNLFRSYREVTGQYVQPRYGAALKAPRIDRLFIPKKALLDAGWNYGIIGVECKASGKKLGPLVAQCLDYSRAAFKLPDVKFDVMCSWIFLWPVAAYAGDIASMMDQNRIGGVSGSHWDLLNFKTASGSLLRIKNCDEFFIRECRQGTKAGSR